MDSRAHQCDLDFDAVNVTLLAGAEVNCIEDVRASVQVVSPSFASAYRSLLNSRRMWSCAGESTTAQDSGVDGNTSKQWSAFVYNDCISLQSNFCSLRVDWVIASTRGSS